MEMELIQKALSALQGAYTIAQNEVPLVAAQLINFSIFLAVWHMLTGLLITLATYIVFRLFSAKVMLLVEDLKIAQDALEKRENYDARRDVQVAKSDLNTYKAFRIVALMIGLFISYAWIYPSAEQLGKLVFTPKLFLIQEGAQVLKEVGLVKHDEVKSK